MHGPKMEHGLATPINAKDASIQGVWELWTELAHANKLDAIQVWYVSIDNVNQEIQINAFQINNAKVISSVWMVYALTNVP